MSPKITEIEQRKRHCNGREEDEQRRDTAVGNCPQHEGCGGNSSQARGHCAPAAKVMEMPSRAMRFQFQRMTSRGAYRVCAVAMAVKMRPKAPQAAKIRGPASDEHATIPGLKAI